ncbi:unnamed protein product [Oppiella nova]|uniref:PSP proline-rich domain-containing protein n=1 Tax=Oppiella nova TaxID=334625 RepID=A0A7R9MEE5_9ACAR|nr:unnamed protein product [Oppiella nova]CAG2174647.1 unnamed protein product [Oppiella nova]
MTATSNEYQRDVSDGQTFSQTMRASNQMQELDNEDTNEGTNEASNDDSTDVESNDETNQSFPNAEEMTTEDVKPIESNFSVQHIISHNSGAPELISSANNTSVIVNPNQLSQPTDQLEESSEDSAQTDVDSIKDENQYIESVDSLDTERSDKVIKDAEEVKEVIKSESPVIQTKTEEMIEQKVEIKPESQTPEVTQESIDSFIKESPVQSIQEISHKPVVKQTSDITSMVKTTLITAVKDETQNGDISETKGKKLTKNQKKKQRKKLQSKRRQLEAKRKEQNNINESDDRMDVEEEDDEEVEIEYIPDAINKDETYVYFAKVFDKFRTGETDNREDSHEDEVMDLAKKMMERKKPVEMELKDEDERRDGEQKVSKRKLKQMTRMTVSELKQRVSHPELVEMHDVTARDPLLLLHLKATRNSVPVPRHWCYKRKYLQGKRGFEKPPFKLPEFIRKTGIMEMRQALQEKEESKSLKAQMREKIRPKMGKIDIDYQKLHDAFFKWQTKPKMTIHGDLYYEGKEFETRLKEKKPGELSNELRTALGMPTGPNSQKCPPPWLIAMQRYGPPPSYPSIKIPGLNAPIPDGCSFGYHAGGWGKPPVDEYGRPLYGDVFGVSTASDLNLIEEEVDRTLWGEMEDESEEEEEEESEEEETEETAGAPKQAAKEVDETGFVTPAEGLITPSGLTSVPTGTETPDMIELRKRKQIEAEMESGDNPSLYTVIPEKKGEKMGREMMGSAHTYDMSASTLRKGQGVDVALDPSDLEAGAGLDSAAMAARYEQTMKERSSHLAKEDLSDMVAEHAARHKRKKPQTDTKQNKKYQFKF